MARVTRPWLFVPLLWGAAFTLSCRLIDPLGGREAGEVSAAGIVLGDSRVALSARLYARADTYFHRGVEHVRARAPMSLPLQRLRDAISPGRHAHLHGTEVREIMPWLWLGIRADPHNVQACLVAAYWLADDLARPDLAVEVLKRAQQENPYNHEIQLDKGRILLRGGHLADAARAFDASLAFWDARADREARDARLDRAAALFYRALLYEAAENRPAAAVALREVLTMFPERTALRERVAALEAGRNPDELASEVWRAMLRQDDQARAICHLDPSHDGDDDAPDGPEEAGGHEPPGGGRAAQGGGTR